MYFGVVTEGGSTSCASDCTLAIYRRSSRTPDVKMIVPIIRVMSRVRDHLVFLCWWERRTCVLLANMLLLPLAIEGYSGDLDDITGRNFSAARPESDHNFSFKTSRVLLEVPVPNQLNVVCSNYCTYVS